MLGLRLAPSEFQGAQGIQAEFQIMDKRREVLRPELRATQVLHY